MSQMPEGVNVFRPPDTLFDILHTKAKRGGYVWLTKQVKDFPVYKYDINQAYAGAMRDCALPAGTAIQCGPDFVEGKPGVYLARIWRDEKTLVPFYFRDAETDQAKCSDGLKPVETWIFSNEIEHLKADNWHVELIDGWYWDSSFNWRDAVNALEKMRASDPDGPSGALGTMVKQVGNSGYGKTLERIDGVSIVLAKECPKEYQRRSAIDCENVFMKTEDPIISPYHQPQIGCFITAHVRVQIREAALGAADAFIYADTDGIEFSREVFHLDVDPKRYGAWKLEAANKKATHIAKKVYEVENTIHAKGMRTRELASADMSKWYDGTPPEQEQLQRINIFKMLAGQPMFRKQVRRGTDVSRISNVRVDRETRIFTPIY
jgi:hypothetical protein